jgi:hypothetical protein
VYVTSSTEAWSLLIVGIGLWALIGAIGHWTSLKEQAAERAHAFEAKVRSALPGSAGGAGYGDILADLGSRTAGFALAYGLGLGFSAGMQTWRGIGRLGQRIAGRPAPVSGTAPGTDGSSGPGAGSAGPSAGPGVNPGSDDGPGTHTPGGAGRGDEAWWGGFFSWLGFFNRATRPGSTTARPTPEPRIELDDPTTYEGELLDDPATPGARTGDTPGIDDAEIVPDAPGQPTPAPGAFIPGPRTSPLPEGTPDMSALASAVARTLNELLAAAARALSWARGASEQADQIANVAGVRARSGVVRSTSAAGYAGEAAAEAARWTANAQAAAAQNVDAGSVASIGNCVLTAGQVAARAQRIAQLSQVAAEAEAAVEAEAHLLAADCVSHAQAAAIAHQTLTASHALHQHAHDATGVAAADKQFYGQA